MNERIKKILLPIYIPFYLVITGIFNKYLLNRVITYIPSWTLRKIYYKCVGIKIGYHSFIDQNVYILNPKGLKLGDFVHINQGCFIDARGSGIKIGNNVSISHYSKLITGGHDYNSSDFKGKFLPIYIDDYVWIGVNCIILQGVKVHEGCVIASGAIVTKDTEEYCVYAGIPAKKIGNRSRHLTYHPLEFENHFRFS